MNIELVHKLTAQLCNFRGHLSLVRFPEINQSRFSGCTFTIEFTWEICPLKLQHVLHGAGALSPMAYYREFQHPATAALHPTCRQINHLKIRSMCITHR